MVGNSTLNSFTICCLQVSHEYFPSISPFLRMVSAQTQVFKGCTQGGVLEGEQKDLGCAGVREWHCLQASATEILLTRNCFITVKFSRSKLAVKSFLN